jgi:hypothetical protein
MASEPIKFTGHESPQEFAQKLNAVLQQLHTDPKFDKIRIGDSGTWLNDEAITASAITLTDGAADGYVLVSDADGVATWCAAPAGGSDPGGAAAELQYNNAGVLGGVTGSTWDGIDLALPASVLASGDLTVAGEFAGARDHFGFGDSTGAVTASKYLKMVNGVSCSTTRGYPTARAGSIVDIALMFYINSYTLGAEVKATAKVNDSGSFNCSWSPSGSAPQVVVCSATQARGLNPFSADELIQSYLTISGTINIGYIEARIGVQLDT